MRRKVTGKLISVLVAVTLLCSLLPAGVLAAPGSVGQIYTVLGDSIPTGYGLLFDSNGTAIRPSGELVPGSYPQLFGSAIGAAETNILCRDGFRTTETLRLIDPSFEQELQVAGNEQNRFFSDAFVSEFADMTPEEFRELQSKAIRQVEQADIITINLANNDTLTYALMHNIIKSEYYDSYGLHPDLRESLIGFLGSLLGVGPVISGTDFLVTALAFMMEGFGTYQTLWNRMIPRILELNPDVEIYVVGMYNPFQHLKLTDFSLVEFGRIANVFVNMVNDFMKNGSPYSDRYTFVDVPDTEVFSMNAVTNPGFAEDFILKIHPNQAGHQYITQQLLSAYTAKHGSDSINRNPSGTGMPFTDVNASTPYLEDIQYCYAHRYMAGTSGTTFDPSLLMTRAMFVTALRAVRNSGSSTNVFLPFTDVPANEYYYEPVKWAYAAGITAGTSPTTFGSNDYVTREQMVQMLYRYAGSPVFTGSAAQYADAGEMEAYAGTSLLWAAASGIIDVSDGRLHPKQAVSRAELALAIHHLSTL